MKSQIDITYLESLIDDDPVFAEELFKIFAENVARNLEKMDGAIKATDNNSWYMACHAFKGSAASVGAFNLSKMLEIGQKNPDSTREEKSILLEGIKRESVEVIDVLNNEFLRKIKG